MGQTSTEAKREIEQTRAHLGETLEALQLRAKRNLDLKTQLQTNHVLQLVVGTLVLAVILGLAGKSMLLIGPPPKTMTTLKEDAEWAKQVLKRNGK